MRFLMRWVRVNREMERKELSELPTGWVETRLGNIINFSNERVEPLAIDKIPYVGRTRAYRKRHRKTFRIWRF